MFIKPTDNYKEFDVFLGKGWENWIRCRISKGEAKLVKTALPEVNEELLRIIYFKIRKFQDKKQEGSE